jgi:hypothetical protein
MSPSEELNRKSLNGARQRNIWQKDDRVSDRRSRTPASAGIQLGAILDILLAALLPYDDCRLNAPFDEHGSDFTIVLVRIGVDFASARSAITRSHFFPVSFALGSPSSQNFCGLTSAPASQPRSAIAGQTMNDDFARISYADNMSICARH